MSDAWSEYYTNEEIKRIQKIELQSLDVLSEVCEKLQIRFFMYGGSLLGTIKYKGFIPWDDDLDIAMLRNDYEKFIEEGPAILSSKYEIQHPKTNKKTPYNYIKFRRRDTALVEYRNHKLKINHGVYFDIYPIDHLPDNYTEYLKQKLVYDKWVSIFMLRQNFRFDKKVSNWKEFVFLAIRFCQHMVVHMLPLSYIMGKIDAISTQYNNQKTIYQGNLTYPKPVNFFNGVDFEKAEFEGRTVFIPNGYAINLLNRYGDIDKMPPVNKRVGHKPYILNLGEEGENAY